MVETSGVSVRLPEGPTDRFTLFFPPDRNALDVVRPMFDQSRLAMCVTDPDGTDNPIVCANTAFQRLTGYAEAEIVGRNCRFLQGPDTSRDIVHDIAEAVAGERVIVTELINYRKDGTPFWNALHVGPIYDQHGAIRFFFGSQWDVSEVHEARERERTAQAASEEAHRRMRNLFSVISSIVGVSAMEATDAKEAGDKARRRIAALGRAHTAINPVGSPDEVRLVRLLEQVLELAGDDGASRLRIEGRSMPLRAVAVTPIGLILHEMTQNSRDHGALGDHGREATVAWTLDSAPAGRFVLEWHEHDLQQPARADRRGMGRRIMSAMATTLNGTIETVRDGDDLVVRVDLPADHVAR